MDRILVSLFIFILITIVYIDINKKYIPNFLNFLLLVLAILLKQNNLEDFFIGAGVYTLPIIILYGYGSDIMNREIIGFGDIKLIVPLGAVLYSSEVSIFFQVYIFYLITFLLASVYILFLFILKILKLIKLNLKKREIAFAPFIILSFFINYCFLSSYVI